MKLLIVTQKIDINDDNLGFFHRWVLEFAEHAVSVVVIAQQVGEYNMPSNVRVLSLGKERGASKPRQLLNFYRYIWEEVSAVDAVFVHMIPMWVVFGAPIFSFFSKPVYLWYTHKSVDWLLRLAEKNVRKIFTASKDSFRLASSKVEVVGHGIDTEYFIPRPERRVAGVYRIMTAGRISASKKIIEMIYGIAELIRTMPSEQRIEFVIIGSSRLPEDEKYLAELRQIVLEQSLDDIVSFMGGIPYSKIAAEYQKSDLFLNFSATGSIDKAVLEAAACGCQILTSNEAFFDLFPPQNIIKDITSYEIRKRIQQHIIEGKLADPHPIIAEHFDLTKLVVKIIDIIKRTC